MRTCNSAVEQPLRVPSSDSSVNNHNRAVIGGVVKIEDIIGDGISGILYNWVNFGKGWCPRWFVLRDGVLSYYKIHGTDKIFVNQETVKGSRVIGDESMRLIFRQQSLNHHRNLHWNGNNARKGKAVGEIHLKVSSIQESQSDDKKFTIFTGTKQLHLRAESKGDRTAWLEALRTVKDMFRRMSKSELIAPMDNLTMPMEKLRKRLMVEGLSEASIQESQEIMKNEFASLQKQLTLWKQKHWLLKDALRQSDVQVKDRFCD